MANLLSAFINFENTISDIVAHLEMEGNVIKHDDFRNKVVYIFFRFRDQYLSVEDVIGFDVPVAIDNVFNDTIKHIKEIKFQFYAYFNAIWC